MIGRGSELQEYLSTLLFVHPGVWEQDELLDALKVGKFYVCGHSRGGVHAMQCAAALPAGWLLPARVCYA